MACSAQPSPLPQDLDVGALLGGTIAVLPPRAGDYRVHLEASQHRYVTREHTQGHSIDVFARIELDQGRFYLELWGSERSTSSHYYPGNTERNTKTDDKQPVHLRLEGRWKGDTLTFERQAIGASFAPVSPEVSFRCVQASTGRFQGALLCTGRHQPLEVLGLLSAGSPRDGSWALRHDLAKPSSDPIPETAQPWFLFGAPLGLKLIATDDRRNKRFEVSSEPVPKAP